MKNNHALKLPEYTEELKRHCKFMRGIPDELLPSMSIFLRNNLARILRDAEIAEACRAYVIWVRAGDNYRMSRAQEKLFTLIAKETP
jgi:hypothetical protein